MEEVDRAYNYVEISECLEDNIDIKRHSFLNRIKDYPILNSIYNGLPRCLSR